MQREGERNRDLWEPLIQGPANAHIHEDLELPLQLQRSLLCFPLRMPSSTPNTVRSLFLSFPSPSLLSPSLSFSPTLFFRICTPPNPCSFLPPNWRACLFYLFISFSPPFSFILYPFLITFILPLFRFLPLTDSQSVYPCLALYRCLDLDCLLCKMSCCLFCVVQSVRVNDCLLCCNYSCTPTRQGTFLMYNVREALIGINLHCMVKSMWTTLLYWRRISPN